MKRTLTNTPTTTTTTSRATRNMMMMTRGRAPSRIWKMRTSPTAVRRHSDDVFPDEYPPTPRYDDDDYSYDEGDTRLALETYHDGDEDSYLSSSKRKKLEALEDTLNELESARDDNEDKLRESKAALGDADYGDDGARWALRDKCVEKTLQGYLYEVCFYKNARQGSTRLGDYRSTEGATLTYDGASTAGTGPRGRSS